jgi:hypothetical protein
MDATYFAEEIVGGLEDVCHPEWRNLHERKITLHSHNAPIHNIRTARRQLESSEFKRMEHLAACDFFLFGYMKGQLKRRSFAEEEELLSVLYKFINEIPPDVILQVFPNWN